MPFWSHPNVLEFTLKGCSRGGDQIGPRGPVEGARSSSTAEAEKLRGMGVGKENSRVKWRRVRNSRAVALYDDGSFTRKSQCTATVLAACRNVHPLTFSVQLSAPIFRRVILNPPVYEAVRRAKIPKNSFIIARVLPAFPACALPILVIDSSQSFRMPYNAHQYFAPITFSAYYMEVAAHSTASLNVLSARCY